jgi:WD40 repeat protein
MPARKSNAPQRRSERKPLAPQHPDAVRVLVDDVAEELSAADAGRVAKILPRFAGEGHAARREECVADLFSGRDPASSDKHFRAFASRLKRAAARHGLELRVSKGHAGARLLQFVAPDDLAGRVASFTRDASDLPGLPEQLVDNPALPGDPLARGEPRTPVSFCVLHAPDEAAVAKQLLDELQPHLAISARFAIDAWDQRRILTGEDTDATVREALARSDFGLLLLSPRMLRSRMLTAAAPVFFGAGSKPFFVVDLHDISERADVSGLNGHKRFRGPSASGSRAWVQCRSAADRSAFAVALFEEIEQRLERWFSGRDRTRERLERAMRGFAPLEEAIPAEENPARRTALHEIAADDERRTPERQSALDMLVEWARSATAPPYAAVLGEFGIGKTTTLKRFAHRLLDLRERGESAPLPIYLDLRTHLSYVDDQQAGTKVPELEPLLDELLRRTWKHAGPPLTGAELLRLVRQEGAVVIFDGLDEKLVHMNEAQGEAFIRTLWQVLPDAELRRRDELRAKGHVQGRIVLSCRSSYFRTLQEQNRTFTGSNRDEVSATRYFALVILPFGDQEIRGYLAKRLGAERVEATLRVIASVNNLQDLAPRPFFLRLIQEQIGRLEERQARGEPVRGVTLYDQLFEDCLIRDRGKHHLMEPDKRLLMEDIAADLWRSGSREWPWELVSDWLGERISSDQRMRSLYLGQPGRPGEAIRLLAEDFRTATLVLRPDDSADRFRFAHTSLQEYFFACHLHRALLDGRLDAWQLTMPSDETLEFVGQLAEVRGDTRWRDGLEALLAEHRPHATRAAFRYWLLARELGLPEPAPLYVDLHGEDLGRWQIRSRTGTPLPLREANLRGAWLVQARLEHVDLSDADLRGCVAVGTEFERVDASRASIAGASFTGSTWRDCRLTGVEIGDARKWWDAHWIRIATGELPEGLGRTVAIAGSTLAGEAEPLAPGHLSFVTACAFSTDGLRIVSASDDSTVKVWDAASGREIATLTGHGDRVNACAFSADGLRIVSASDDSTVKVWDAASCHEVATLTGHGAYVNACAFSADGLRIVSGSRDSTVKVWDAASGRELATLNGHDAAVTACAFSADGLRIVSGSFDSTVKVWDAASGRELATLNSHGSHVTACAFSADGLRIVSGSWDRTVKVWDVTSGRELATLNGHGSAVNACAFSADGLRVVSGSFDRTIKVWDTARGRELATLTGHSAAVTACAFSADGLRIVSGSDDSTIKVWDAASGRELITLTGYSSHVNACAFRADGLRIVSGSFDRTVKVWDAASGRELATLTGHGAPVNACAFSTDGLRIVSGSDDRTVKVWDSASGRELATLTGHDAAVNACAFSADGLRVVSGSDDRTVKVRDAASGREIATLTGHDAPVNACAFSTDGLRIVSGSDDRTAKVWAAASGRELATLAGHGGRVNACAFSADGLRIVSASDDSTVKVWDAASGRELATLTGHGAHVNACAFSADGLRIVSGSWDRTVKVWDAASGRELATLTGHGDPVTACAFSPDGLRIVSGSWDSTVKVWDAANGRDLLILHHFAGGEAAAIDTPGRRILWASPGAWRNLAWRAWCPERRVWRNYPAEMRGPLPG